MHPQGTIRTVYVRLLTVLAVALWATASTATGLAQGTWNARGPYGASVQALAIDPHDPDIVYLSASSVGVFRSTDGTVTWNRTGLAFDGIVTALIVDPGDGKTVHAATTSGYVRSEDGGETWSRRNAGLSSTYLNTIAVDASRPGTLYAGAWGGLFKTTDDGRQWTPIGVSLGEIDVQAVRVARSDPETVYIATSGRGVFRSGDAGQHWTARSNGLPEEILRDLIIDPSDPDLVYAATNRSGVYLTTDGGITWVSSSGSTIRSSFRLALDPAAPSTLYAGTQGAGIFRSEDRGATWQAWNDGLPNGASIYGLSVRPDTGALYAGLFSLGVYGRTREDERWIERNSGLTGYVVSAAMLDAQNGVLFTGIETYGPSIFRSTDQGRTWAVSNRGMSYPPVYCLAQDPAVPGRLLSGNAGSLYRSEDGGATWVASDAGLERGFVRVYTLLFDADDPTTVYAGTTRGLWTSVDGGVTWGRQRLADVPIRCLVQSPNDSRHLTAGGDRGRVYDSVDRGATWVQSNDGLPGTSDIRTLSYGPGSNTTLYAGTDGSGIFTRADGDAPWVPQPQEGSIERTFVFLRLSEVTETLVAGTASGVFRYEPVQDRWIRVGKALPEDTTIRTLRYDHDKGILYAGGDDGLFTLAWAP